ncbi:hypothetical protein [Paraburkholderia pallida]|uniref:Uncharacterized protein n=1 Tax=Paraburkholderia pallida TaxID=2547399 RepID=A0A4P7D1W5_9BURK|nr:hypothetical protein [Paraburkholderia pallida]QBR00482.1 hypothetical protein E1956_25950 [Paraburkholderia pallida]
MDDLNGAYERLQAARARFEKASNALRERPDGDFSELARALEELNLAQKLFADAAAKIVKNSG